MAITLKTDKKGLAIIDRARIHKSWSALAVAWCQEANVSVSTLKRFRERKAIQKSSFISICQAVGVEDWERVIAQPEVEPRAALPSHGRQSTVQRSTGQQSGQQPGQQSGQRSGQQSGQQPIGQQAQERVEKSRQASDRVAQEILSQLSHLDAQIEFVDQVFVESPVENQLQLIHQQVMPPLVQSVLLSRRQRLHPYQRFDFGPNFLYYPLRIEANVSIIQILVNG